MIWLQPAFPISSNAQPYYLCVLAKLNHALLKHGSFFPFFYRSGFPGKKINTVKWKFHAGSLLGYTIGKNTWEWVNKFQFPFHRELWGLNGPLELVCIEARRPQWYSALLKQSTGISAAPAEAEGHSILYMSFPLFLEYAFCMGSLLDHQCLFKSYSFSEAHLKFFLIHELFPNPLTQGRPLFSFKA